jgi:hypothetical protein
MAAPSVFSWIAANPDPHRVEVDVPDEFQKVAIPIDQKSLFFALVNSSVRVG